MDKMGDFRHNVAWDDHYAAMSLPIACLSRGETCGYCNNWMTGSKRGYVHRNTGRKYHERCGSRFSNKFGCSTEDAGLIEARFEPIKSKMERKKEKRRA